MDLSGKAVASWGNGSLLGSYTLNPRHIKGLRIVSVNSVFFSNKYQSVSFPDGCKAARSDGPARTFSWLESTLSRAAQNHEKVWIMMHIPPGIDGYSTMVRYRSLSQAASSPPPDLCSQAIVPMWKPFWTDLFDRLVAQYPTTITAIFAGHNHTDDFRVIDTGQAGRQFVLIDPPISPIYGQNPAFRIVTFAAGGGLTDQTTWYLTNRRQLGVRFREPGCRSTPSTPNGIVHVWTQPASTPSTTKSAAILTPATDGSRF